MAFIDIVTNNLSRDLTNSVTASDNWVYVPGTAITGDYSKPLLFTSLSDFQDTCGTRSPEGSNTYEYVAGLLNAGLPVIFRRIACKNQDGEGETLGVEQAFAEFSHEVPNDEEPENPKVVKDFIVKEKYGGTFGNDLYITIRYPGSAVWIDVILDKTLIERKRIATITANDEGNTEVINAKVIKGLKTIEFDRIEITDINDDPATFSITPKDRVPLSGGKDFPEKDVVGEIAYSYRFIRDKMLYQPKFITSGGYTDDTTDGSWPIATAMKNLTLQRQDCRAIIDLPLCTPKSDYSTHAASLSYNQYTSSTEIPSASMYAPWAYMRIGSDTIWMPPSYVFLTTLGNRLLEGKQPYNPVAGLSTGIVRNIVKTEFEIGSDTAEEWQSDTEVNINPIMKMNGSTYVIGGNSTLLVPEEETGETNIFLESSADLTVIDIRRFVYNLATELQYQYNSVVAFENFGLRTSEYLNRMISEGAVIDYAIYNESTDTDPRTLKIRLDVYISPTIKKIQITLNVGYGSIEIDTEGGNG